MNYETCSHASRHQSYKYNYLEIQRWRKHWLPRQHWSLCWCQEWTLLWEKWLWPRLWSRQHAYGSRKTPSPRCVCVAAAAVGPGSQIYTHKLVSSSIYVTVLLITIRHSLHIPSEQDNDGVDGDDWDSKQQPGNDHGHITSTVRHQNIRSNVLPKRQVPKDSYKIFIC